MNVVYQSLGLLLLVTGALSATIATLGATCAVGDTCSVNAAVCDMTSLKCVCQFGYVQSGTICSRPHFGLCGVGMCKSPDKMTCDTTTKTCKCDATKGYVVSGNGCACDSAAFKTAKTGGGCIGNLGAACTAASDCQEGMLCTNSICACDTALHYGAGTNGDPDCSCDTGYADSNGLCCATGSTESNGICCTTGTQVGTDGVCKKALGETCTAGQCARSMICDATPECACDTTGHYVAGAGGATACVGNLGAACALATDCATGMVCTNNLCACNTALHYGAGAVGDATCTCASGYTLSNGLCCATGSTNSNGICCASGSTESNGACKKVWGQACAAGECHPDLICDTTCKCDATLGYAAGSAGAETCSCNSGAYFADKTGGGCIGNVGAACSANSDCRTDAGMVCTDSKCACDTTKDLLAGSDGAATCACAAGFTYFSFFGKCAINVGGECTRDAGTYVPCVAGATCDRATDTCKCDSAAGYMTSGTGCGCNSGYSMVNGRCAADVNGVCIPSTTSGVCVGGATCFAGNATTVPQCLCASNRYDYKGSCSGGAGGVVASLAGLLMALFMTSRLM